LEAPAERLVLEEVLHLAAIVKIVAYARFQINAQLGMPNAFNRQLAEFPDFCNVPTFIGLMKQVARIKLSEEGTEAAAVTVIGVVKTSVGGPSIVHFHANRPFLYVISERSSGAVFFIGQYYGD